MKYMVLLFLSGFTQVFSQYFDWDTVTPLDEYINRDDGYFDYYLIRQYSMPGYITLVYNMTSQIWMDESVSTQPVWSHHLSIAIPDEIVYPDAAHLYIGGGRNTDNPPYPGSSSGMQYIADFARNTGAVAIYLQQIPNEPIYFADDPDTAYFGDDIIARTWRYYVEEIVDDTDVILLLPMTKAAKMAVDAIVEIVQNETGNAIERIYPTGGSKRAWAAWLLSCVDPRVFAVAPRVFDIGNWHDNLHHHYEAYGGWSFAFISYWSENMTRYIDHPRAFEVFDDIGIDYMRYNPRLTMPKFIISGTNDELFLPDDSHYFFDELSEPKYLLICENGDHGLDEHEDRIDQNVMNFFVAVLEGFQLPEISWERLEHGSHADLDMICNDEMIAITSWWADTTNRSCENRTIDEEEGEKMICRRDFRQQLLVPPGENPIEFVETEVLDLGGGLFRVRMDYRDDEVDGPGYRGFFMTMRFPGYREGDELHFSTEMHIIPDSLPYPRCATELQCLGRLV